MKKVAWFTYYGESPTQNRTVRFYQDVLGEFIVDAEGYPMLTRRSKKPAKAVAIFSDFREMAMKDRGASAVYWGDYAEYSQYWPEDATPWDIRI